MAPSMAPHPETQPRTAPARLAPAPSGAAVESPRNAPSEPVPWQSSVPAPAGSKVGQRGKTVPGQLGVWEQVDLPAVEKDDQFQSIAQDPVRPSDFYFSAGAASRTMRWWRSTDFGATWEVINDFSMQGLAWGFSIDPNPARDPSTPPTLWSPAGTGSMGAWKSVDGGFTWQRSLAADTAFAPYNPFVTDLYHIQILPDDPPNHVIATYHYAFKDSDAGGIGETWDGGKTWVVHPPPKGMGTSHYVIPMSATTWCLINQETGTWRTTTAGRIGGTAAKKYRDGTISTRAWKKVDDIFHFHGSYHSVLVDGVWYVAGVKTVKKTSDLGATWHSVISNFDISAVTATDKFLYGAWGFQPALSRAPRNDETKWQHGYAKNPQGMSVGPGPFGMGSAYDPKLGRWVVLIASWKSGLWRYVEP